MTSPEDKAKELVMVFMNYQPIKMSDYTKIEYPSAVNLAKILCDHLANENLLIEEAVNAGFHGTYWIKVKNELDKL